MDPRINPRALLAVMMMEAMFGRERTMELLLGPQEPADPTQHHRHRCPDCGTVWQHSDARAGDGDAHRCPECGAEEFVRYHGDIEPAHIDPWEGPQAA